MSAESALHIDTHIFAALHDGEPVGIDLRARRLIGSMQVRVSPLVLFELELIKHKTKISIVSDAFETLRELIGLEVAHSPLVRLAQEAVRLGWTREPMDRLIVAHAIADGARLITKDERIRANFPGAVW